MTTLTPARIADLVKRIAQIKARHDRDQQLIDKGTWKPVGIDFTRHVEIHDLLDALSTPPLASGVTEEILNRIEGRVQSLANGYKGVLPWQEPKRNDTLDREAAIKDTLKAAASAIHALSQFPAAPSTEEKP